MHATADRIDPEWDLRSIEFHRQRRSALAMMYDPSLLHSKDQVHPLPREENASRCQCILGFDWNPAVEMDQLKSFSGKC